MVLSRDRVAVTSKKYYHFIRKRAESETAKYRDDMYAKREEEDGWMRDLYAHWDIDSEEIREFLARRYIERVIGCVENVTNKNCTIKRKEKISRIKGMISNAKAQSAVRTARPNSFYMRLMLLPVKLNSATVMYLEGKVISFVKSGNTKLFARLKAKR